MRTRLPQHDAMRSAPAVRRGEAIVDEEALLDALERGHLRGAALDVYVGELERPPTPLLCAGR